LKSQICKREFLPCHLEEDSDEAAAAFATFRPPSRCTGLGFQEVGRSRLGPRNEMMIQENDSN
jgi:hypothetical protein